MLTTVSSCMVQVYAVYKGACRYVQQLRYSPLQRVNNNVHLPGSLLPSGAASSVLADPG
jgi:hypothetical protein